MTRLAERYRPQWLSEVVGQPAVDVLRRFARKPYSNCFLLTGPPGTGKSASALALAAELGAVDPWSGLEVVSTADLGKDECDRQLKRLWQCPLNGQWNVLVIEELERLSPQAQIALKVGLASENLPPRAVVVATSNDVDQLDPALLERFGVPLKFFGWTTLAEAASQRLAWIWSEVMESPLPDGAGRWGWTYRDGKAIRFSFRAALDACQQAMLLAEMECAA